MRRLATLLLLGLLSASVVMAQDVVTEDIGTLAIGDRASGELAIGARDRYTVEITEDTTLNFYLDGTGGMDMYLRVYQEGGEEPIAENDDRGDGSLNSAVYELEVAADDVLVVEAGTYGDGEEGAYTLRVAPLPTIEDASAITLGEPVEGTFPENTRYRYTLDVEDTTALSILLEGADDLDTYLRFYLNGEETPSVQSNDIEEGNVSAGFTTLVVPGGTSLVIEAGTAADGGSGDYTLTIDTAELEVGDVVTPVEFNDDSTVDGLCEGAADTADPVRVQYVATEEVLEADVDYGAVFCTEAGNFRIDLYEDEAPIATNSFVFLAERHFFDNLTFHRVIADFVVQGGDPQGTGSGGPGYEFVNETDNDLTYGGIGVLGMANAGPDTNGSQFFITLAPVARLDGGYTIFGQVQEGMASVFDVEVRDPSTATEPGTAIYTIIIVTTPPAEE